MNNFGTRQKRIRDKGDGFSEEEKQFAVSLSPSRVEAARILNIGGETLYELLSPHGRVQPKTLERVRSRIAELKGGST